MDDIAEWTESKGISYSERETNVKLLQKVIQNKDEKKKHEQLCGNNSFLQKISF